MFVGDKLEKVPELIIGIVVFGIGIFVLSLLHRRVGKAVFRVVRHFDEVVRWQVYGSVLKVVLLTPAALRTEGMDDLIQELWACILLQRWWRKMLRKQRNKQEGRVSTFLEVAKLAAENKKNIVAWDKRYESMDKALGDLSGKDPTWKDPKREARRKRRERQKDVANLYSMKHMPKKNKIRKLLYDTGSWDTFRRFSRVRVMNMPWELDRIEVALEVDGPVFGAFVVVEPDKDSGEYATPPFVSRVQPGSLADRSGIKRGYWLLKVGRLEWPHWPAPDMLKEIQSGRRPMFLILEAPGNPAIAKEPPRLLPQHPDHASAPMPPEASPPALPPQVPLPTGEPPSRPSRSRPSRATSQGSLGPSPPSSAPGNMELIQPPEVLPHELAMVHMDTGRQFQNGRTQNSLEDAVGSEGYSPSGGNSGYSYLPSEGGASMRRSVSERFPTSSRPQSAGVTASSLRLNENSRMREANLQRRPMSATSPSQGDRLREGQRQCRPMSASSSQNFNMRPGSAGGRPPSSGNRAARRIRPPSAGGEELTGSNPARNRPASAAAGGKERAKTSEHPSRSRPSSAAATTSRKVDKDAARMQGYEASHALGSLLGI